MSLSPFCGSCGTAFEDAEARFCPSCGAPRDEGAAVPVPAAASAGAATLSAGAGVGGAAAPAARPFAPTPPADGAGTRLEDSYLADSELQVANRSSDVSVSSSMLHKSHVEIVSESGGATGGPVAGAPAGAVGASSSAAISDSYISNSTVTFVQNTTVTSVDPAIEQYREQVLALVLQVGLPAVRRAPELLERVPRPPSLEPGRALVVQNEITSALEATERRREQEQQLLAQRAREAAAAEALRPKYRVARGSTPIEPGRMLTAAEVVAYVNVNQKLGYAHRVDVDGSGEWHSVWAVPEILQHPDLRTYCSRTGEALPRSEVRVCRGCERPFRKALVAEEGLCGECAAAKAARVAALVEPPPAPVATANLDPADWVRVLPERFLMGSPVTEAGRDADEREHHVQLTRAFLVARLPVTNALYARVTGTDAGNVPDMPRVNVSWLETLEFCNAYSRQLGLPCCYSAPSPRQPDVQWDESARGVRLLTEAEWEYACRAGSKGPYYADVGDELYLLAVYDTEEMEPLGARQPNAWGIHDMLGTVREWVWDGRGEYVDDVVDPVGESTQKVRVMRGGSYADPPETCRCAKRQYAATTSRSELVGFRIAITV